MINAKTLNVGDLAYVTRHLYSSTYAPQVGRVVKISPTGSIITVEIGKDTLRFQSENGREVGARYGSKLLSEDEHIAFCLSEAAEAALLVYRNRLHAAEATYAQVVRSNSSSYGFCKTRESVAAAVAALDALRTAFLAE